MTEPVYLTAEQADRDDVHRRHCCDNECTDAAHLYVAAVLAGRPVFVEGVPFLDYQARRRG